MTTVEQRNLQALLVDKRICEENLERINLAIKWIEEYEDNK